MVVIGIQGTVWESILSRCISIGHVTVAWHRPRQSTINGLVVLQRATGMGGTVNAGIAMNLVQPYVPVTERDRCMSVIVIIRVIVGMVRCVVGTSAVGVIVNGCVVAMVIRAMTMSVPMLSSCELYLEKGDDCECGDRDDEWFRHVFHFVVSFARRQRDLVRQEGRTRLVRPSN